MADPDTDTESEDLSNFDRDSALGASSSTGSLTDTLTSNVLRGVEEYGRIYPSYGAEEYGMPIDDQELERIDMNHAKLLVLLDKKLFLAPINPNPQRILDLGTGTGLWAMEVADQFPSAEVRGADIAHVQPDWVPPNCLFEIEDIEMPWTWAKNSFDLIHARSLMLSIRDWPRLIAQCYEHIKPGGWVELQTSNAKISCDDGSTPEDSGLMAFTKLAFEASEIAGFALSEFEKWKLYLEKAGFVDVVEVRYKMPSSPWPEDKRMKLIGAFEQHNMLTGMSGMSLRLFSKAFGWSQERTERYLVDVRRDIKNLDYHSYWEFIIVYGRKPEQGATSKS